MKINLLTLFSWLRQGQILCLTIATSVVTTGCVCVRTPSTEVYSATFGRFDYPDNLTPTNRVSHQVGAMYAWRLTIRSNKDSVRVKEVFKLPRSAHWGGDSQTTEGLKIIRDSYSQSGSVKITEYDLENEPDDNGESKVTVPYRVNNTDPQGTHRISIFVEGKLINEFTFQVVDDL